MQLVSFSRLDNPCTSDCELCDQKTGVCLRQPTKSDLPPACDPPCEDDEVCIDGECSWSNMPDGNTNHQQCQPPCPLGSRCHHQQCQPLLASHCPITCRFGQVCVDGRCGCYRGVCAHDRSCYEICQADESCFNLSCSCGTRGKCGQGEICQSDVCMCGSKAHGCRAHEHCVNGFCVCKTSPCDECNTACQSNERCLDGKCVCVNQCERGRSASERTNADLISSSL